MRRPAKASSTSGCETGYPTTQQLFAFFDNGTNFASGYGAGPGCSGNINPTLYEDYRVAPQVFFHDVTGAGHIATNNGLFPAVRGFDLATGIGTIKIGPFIVGLF